MEFGNVFFFLDQFHNFKLLCEWIHKSFHSIVFEPLQLSLAHVAGESRDSTFAVPQLYAIVSTFVLTMKAYNTDVEGVGCPRTRLLALFTHSRPLDPRIIIWVSLLEVYLPLALNHWNSIEQNDIDSYMEELVMYAAVFQRLGSLPYAKSTLHYFWRLDYLQRIKHPLFDLFCKDMRSFSILDLENTHSALSRLVARLRDQSDDNWIIELCDMFDVLYGNVAEVERVFAVAEPVENGRIIRSLPNEADGDVAIAHEYLVETFASFQEHMDAHNESSVLRAGDSLAPSVHVAHASGAVTYTCDEQVYTSNLFAPLSFEALQPLIALLPSIVTKTKATKCGCKTACRTKACGCVKVGETCGEACECSKQLCMNKECL